MLIRRNMHCYLRTKLLTCLFPSFRLYNLTHLSLNSYTRRYCRTSTGNLSKTTFRKLLMFCQGTLLTTINVKYGYRGVKNWTTFSDHGTLNLLIKTCLVSNISHWDQYQSWEMQYSCHTDFFLIHANIYAQKSWKRTCPGFKPAMSLFLSVFLEGLVKVAFAFFFCCLFRHV